jgi:hypothetical protein
MKKIFLCLSRHSLGDGGCSLRLLAPAEICGDKPRCCGTGAR